MPQSGPVLNVSSRSRPGQGLPVLPNARLGVATGYTPTYALIGADGLLVAGDAAGHAGDDPRGVGPELNVRRANRHSVHGAAVDKNSGRNNLASDNREATHAGDRYGTDENKTMWSENAAHGTSGVDRDVAVG